MHYFFLFFLPFTVNKVICKYITFLAEVTSDPLPTYPDLHALLRNAGMAGSRNCGKWSVSLNSCYTLYGLYFPTDTFPYTFIYTFQFALLHSPTLCSPPKWGCLLVGVMDSTECPSRFNIRLSLNVISVLQTLSSFHFVNWRQLMEITSGNLSELFVTRLSIDIIWGIDRESGFYEFKKN